MKATMPSTASGYSGARGDPMKAIKATALIACTQRVALDIAAYRAFLKKETVIGIKAADVTPNAIRLPSAMPWSR